jgi:hypothetical protein
MLHAETQMSLVTQYQRAWSALCTAAVGARAAPMVWYVRLSCHLDRYNIPKKVQRFSAIIARVPSFEIKR